MDIMKKIKTSSTGTKLLALLLVVIMAVSLLPMAVLADLFPAADKASTDTTAVSEDSYDRIIMLDCGRKYFTADWIKALIVEAHAAGYTQLQLNFGNDGLRFLLNDMSFTANGNTYDHATVVSKVEAGNEAQNSSGDKSWLTQTEMDEIIACAKENSIEIVPMLNLPGHANAILDIFDDDYNATGSNNTLDVANSEEARKIGYAILQKYVTYFADKGCKYFNFGADEYANDAEGTFSFSRLDSTQYANFVAFVNDMADIIKTAKMTPRCFNDGLYYNGQNEYFDTDIQCCYWSSGWGSYPVASATTIAAKGHKMINTNGDYYYVLGKDDKFDSGYSYASNFSNTAFMSSTISDPVGSMFCIWCDYPNAESEEQVAAKVLLPLRAMAARMQNKSIDGISTDVVENGFNLDGSIYAPKVVKNETTGIEISADGNISSATITYTGKVENDTASVTWDISLKDNDDNAYSGSATLKVLLSKYADFFGNATAFTGYVTNDDGSNKKDFDVKLVDGYLVFTVPHFSKVTVSAVLDNDDDSSITETKPITLSIGGTETITISGENLSASVDKTKLDTSIATVDVVGQDGNSVSYQEIAANTYSNKTVGGTGATGGKYKMISGYYYKVGDTFYPLYAKITSGGNYTWAYSSIVSTTNLTADQVTTITSISGRDKKISFVLYKASDTPTSASTTITFTGVYPGTTYVTVGTVKYEITVNHYAKNINLILTDGAQTDTQTKTISGSVVNSNPDVVQVTYSGKTVTFTPKAVGDATVTLGDTVYSVKVVPADFSSIADFPLEYWITNGRVTADGSNSYALTAEAAYGQNGISVTSIAPENGTHDGKAVEYWRCVLLDRSTHEQTGNSGDDETLNGVSFSKIRYYNGSWAVYTENNEWVNVNSSTQQFVAYYFYKITINNANTGTSELKVDTADWGSYVSSSNTASFGYSESSAKCSLSFQIVYEDGTTNPNGTTLNDLNLKTIVYAFGTTRGIGTVLLTAQEGFEIYKVTSEYGKLSVSNSSSATFTLTSFSWTNKETTVWEDGVTDQVVLQEANGSTSTTSPLVWRSASSHQNAILIRVYVKAVATKDSLNVEYYNMADNDCFYNYNINVAQGTTFDADFAKSGDGLENNSVVNYYGVKQTVQSDLSLMPQIGAQYRYAKYTLDHVERSSDGKTVKLYYNFNNTVNFVVDFGLPLEFALTDISANLANAQKIDAVVLSGASYGTAVYNESTKKITYTPNSILRSNESIGVTITGTITYTDTDGSEKTESSTVSFIVNIVPASTVYYEDSFASFTNGKGSANAAWSIDGTEQSANQLLAVLGNDSNLFGYDDAYKNKNATTFSMGSAHKVTVNKTMNDTWNENSAWPYAGFKFKGTGFDLISLTNNDSGIITYEVWTLDANDKPLDLVCKKFVNNYYGYSFVDGKWVEAASGAQEALYQIPVVKVSDLTYGSYYVKVTVAYGEVFDLTSDGMYSFWLDGVRVYNTRGADYAYYGDNESYPQFIELHNALAASGDNYQAVMIEGKENADLTEYTEMGPNHEVYIANGQSIAFKLNGNLDKIATVQLGAKAVNGAVSFTVTNTNGTSEQFTIDTATDLYYDITRIANNGDTVIITNEGNNLLSLTTVKVTFTEDVEVSLGMTKTEATAAVMYVRSMYAIPAEPFAPEYLKAKWNTPLAVTGKNATLTVTASEDVEAVCVDGEIIEDYTTRTIITGWGSNRTTDTYRVFTYTVTAIETADFTVSAFNADGVESDSVTATLYVWGGLGWFKDIIGRLF